MRCIQRAKWRYGVSGRRQPLNDFCLDLWMRRPPGQTAVGASQVDENGLGVAQHVLVILQDRQLPQRVQVDYRRLLVRAVGHVYRFDI